MNLIVVILFACLMQVSASGLAQRITLSAKDAQLEQILKSIKSQSGMDVVYPNDLVDQAKKVNVKLSNTPLEEALKKVFENQPFSYELSDNTIIVKTKAPSFPDRVAAAIANITIHGRVVDNSGAPLQNASIQVKGNPEVFTSNKDGAFSIPNMPENVTLVIKYVGFMPVTIKLQDRSIAVEAGKAVKNKGATQEETEENAKSTATMNAAGVLWVKLARFVVNMETVIVTGIVNKKKESFTGSAATYSQKELMQVGGTNILQSLKTLDPAFAMRENVQFGSDPNRLPDLEIRGKTGLIGERDALSIDPNQPLFILDGFESSLKTISDLDINRVESITILKDAASTAIYGSKAANGVVVVETVKPKAGKLQVNYSARYNIQAPDLSSYNMMDAAEKLEFERLSGRFDPQYSNSTSPSEAELIMAQLYYDRLGKFADEGVNTYWLAEPLRAGANQNHSVFVTGGEGNFQFSIGAGYNGITGVMKDSRRNKYQGNIDLNYRKSKLQFSNKLSVQTARFQNPIVPFTEFATANPYYKKTNDGVVEPYLEKTATTEVFNPMWDASRNSRDIGKDLQFSNFFSIEWFPSNSWRVRARVGLTSDDNESEQFLSPDDQIWRATDINSRGSFRYNNTKAFRSEGDLMVSYAKVINKHQINLTGGSNINSRNSLLQGYSVQGFTALNSGEFTYPNFSRGYPQGEGVNRPIYRDNTSRDLNAYFNAGYAFNERYLLDLNLRSSGSSVFGTNRRFNNTWSVGLGWNLHREQFIANMGWINFLKIRGSVGNPGNQNFASNQTLQTFVYNPNIRSYFGLTARPDQLGDPDLEWQITRDKNIGMDLTAFNRRFSLNIDYFHKLTNPLLININTPSSSGSITAFTNAGQQTGQGLNISTSYQILNNTQRRILWSIRANGRTLKQRLDGIGNQLERFNTNSRGRNFVRYRDGADPDDLWAVKSMGIDPATGRELYLTKDGIPTFDWSYDNEVIVGNTRPDLEGIVGSSFTLGGFTLNLNFRYQFGAEVFNSALVNKVENVNMYINQDRRALYDRWQKPGDISYFKNIRDNTYFSRTTSRFLQPKNSLIMESISAEYQFRGGWVKKAGLGNFRVFATARDVFEYSTMQVERGIDYPFARFFDTGLSFNF